MHGTHHEVVQQARALLAPHPGNTELSALPQGQCHVLPTAPVALRLTCNHYSKEKIDSLCAFLRQSSLLLGHYNVSGACDGCDIFLRLI